MKCVVDYEDEITCEDAINTTGVSNTNDVYTGNTNARYRSYAKATISMFKSHILHAPRQGNSTYVQTVRRSIYETR